MRFCSIYLFVPIALALGLVLAVWTFSQPAQVKTLSATVDADEMTWNWGTNLTEFTGNCKVVIISPQQATLTAPRISLKLEKSDAGQSVIHQLKTVGATHLTLITQPDSKGIRRKMTGTASQGATYSERSNTVVLAGGAKIDSVSLPEGADSEHISFTAEALSVNLATETITASKGHMKISIIEPDKTHLQVETPLESESQE